MDAANTQLDKANERLQINNRMQQEFINIAAHELRTPVQPILGMSQLLRLRSNDFQNIRSLDIIIRNAIRLQRLTEDILDVQRIDSQTLQLNKERFNIYELISSLILDYQNQLEDKKKRVTIRINHKLIPLKPVTVYADKNRIAQVIQNLLDNAVKFTERGSITVNIEHNREDMTNVRVKDTGHGIDANILNRLFSKFVSKSFQGIGLGLFISKGIIEAHGGKISAENNSNGIGATFSFSLPS